MYLLSVISLCVFTESVLGSACTKKNEVFYAAPKCVPQCHQTCDSYLAEGRKPQACTDQCISNSCGCPEENLRDSNENCITEQECKESIACAPGEIFYDFHQGLGCAPCDRDCDNYYKSEISCTLACESHVCRCAPGYVRNLNADVKGCIPTQDCPINDQCGKNAMLYWDGFCSPCKRTCDNFYREHFACLLICNKEECICKDDFVRNANKECVAIAQCPAPTCGDGERFYGPNECRPCEDTCQKSALGPTSFICTKECVSNVCACQAGFKRNSATSCVEICPAA